MLLTKTFRKLLIICFSLILLVFIIIGAALMLPFLIYRFCVSYLNIIRPDLDGIIELRNVVFIPKDFWKFSRLVVISKYRINGKMKADCIKELFTNKRIKNESAIIMDKRYRRLQQYPYSWMGYYFWKWEENFNINDHVHQYSCDKLNNNPDYKFSENEVMEIENSMYTKLFTKNKSLWEIVLVPNKVSDSEEEQTLVIFRINHSIADGFSTMILLMELFGDENAENEIDRYKNSGMINWRLKLKMLTRTIVYGLYDLTESSFKVNVFESKLWKRLKFKETEKLLSAESKLISMDAMKEIASTHSVGVTAVVYSVITSAVRKALIKNRGSTPENVCSTVAMPMCGHPDKLTNHLTGGIISLPVGESDPLKRLKMVHHDVQKAKHSTTQIFQFYVGIIFSAPLYYFTQSYIDSNKGPAVIPVSSFPACKSKFSAEYGLQSISFAATLGFVTKTRAIGFTTCSYNNKLQFMVAGHNATFTDENLKDIISTIEEEIEILKNHAVV